MLRPQETPTVQRLIAEALRNKTDRISIRRDGTLGRSPATLFILIGERARQDIVPDLNRICQRLGNRDTNKHLQLDGNGHIDQLFKWLEDTQQNYCTAGLLVNGAEVWMFACVGAQISLEVAGLLSLRGCLTKV